MTRPLAKIHELAYTGTANLLVRYLNQGRARAKRASVPPRRLVSWITARPITYSSTSADTSTIC